MAALHQEVSEKSVGYGERLVLLLSLVPVYGMFRLIHRYAVNVPYWDNWHDLVAHYLHRDLPRLDFGAFWRLGNEHRQFVPFVIEAAVAHLSSLNMLVIIWLEAAVWLATAVTIFFVFRRQERLPAASAVALPFSLLAFAPGQWPRYTDPRLLAWMLAIFGFVGAIAALQSGPPRRSHLLLATAMATLSSLSYSPGNAAWPVVAVLAWHAGYRRLRDLAVPALVAVVVLGTYANDFAQTQSLSLSGPRATPLDAARFAAILIGSPFSAVPQHDTDDSSALAFGVAGTIAFLTVTVVLVRAVEGGAHRVVPWLTMAGWVVAGAIAAGFGRTGRFGLHEARADRYTAFATVFWMALTALATTALLAPLRPGARGRTASRLVVGTGMALVLLVAIGWTSGAIGTLAGDCFSPASQQAAKGLACLAEIEGATDICLTNLYPDPALVRREVAALAARGVVFGPPGFRPDFDDMAIDSPFPGGTARDYRTVAGFEREVLHQYPPAVLSFLVTLDPERESHLRTGLRVDRWGGSGGPRSDGVWFRIHVVSDGATTQLFQEYRTSRGESDDFRDLLLDLTPYAGKTVEVRMSTACGPFPTSNCVNDWAVWFYPRVLYGPARATR